MNDIDLITLEHMSNSNYCYRKPNKNKNEKKVTKSDKKFYRKRIIHETKNMFKNEFKNDSLKQHFNDYIFSLISYFKLMDKIDIIQTDYNGNGEKKFIDNFENIDILSDCCDGDDEISDTELSNKPTRSYNNQILNVTEKKKITLDNFVKSNKPKQPIYIIPTQKEIDLKQPALKEKGIKNKNKPKELNENLENNKELLYNGERTNEEKNI